MEKREALRTLRTILDESGIVLLESAQVFDNEEGTVKEGLFFTKPSPDDDILWCGEVRSEEGAFETVPVLRFSQLWAITYTPRRDDENEIEIYFELGTKGLMTHRIRYSFTDFTDMPSSSDFSVLLRQEHRWAHCAEALSIMADLCYSSRPLNLQVAIDSLVHKCLSTVRVTPDTETLVALEERLRKDMEEGNARVAVQYLMLALHGTDEVPAVFDREFALATALRMDGVPAMYRDCMIDRFIFVWDEPKLAKALTDMDALVIRSSLVKGAEEELSGEHLAELIKWQPSQAHPS